MPIKKQLLENSWVQLFKDKAAGPRQELSHPDYQGKIGLIFIYSKDFWANCYYLRIYTTGKLHLFLYAVQGLDIRPAIQSDDSSELPAKLVILLGDKKATHRLQDGYTDATKNLAMLGA
jgi:cyclic pyranopterin phosphate synthase